MVTADALHTHRGHADWLVEAKHADYVFTVKANQPTLLDRCAALPWHNVPELDRTRDHAHGRVEIRTPQGGQRARLRLPARRPGPPGHPQGPLPAHRTRRKTQTVYALTSLTHAQASPARLADLLRGHWAIENGLHHVRDTTFAEDASQVRAGSTPHVMTCLRNLVIGALRRTGPGNLTAALRHHSRDPHRPLVTLGISLG